MSTSAVFWPPSIGIGWLPGRRPAWRTVDLSLHWFNSLGLAQYTGALSMRAVGRARFVSRTAAAFLLLPALLAAPSAPAKAPPSGAADVPLKARQAIVVDADSGAVLYQRN